MFRPHSDSKQRTAMLLTECLQRGVVTNDVTPWQRVMAAKSNNPFQKSMIFSVALTGPPTTTVNQNILTPIYVHQASIANS